MPTTSNANLENTDGFFISSRLLKLFRFIFTLCIIVGSFMVLGASRARATDVTDNFNRADGGLGANWTTVTGADSPQISNNNVTVGLDGALHSAYWSANSFNNNQYSQASFPNSLNGVHFGPAVAVRLSGSTGYFLYLGNGNGILSIWRMDGVAGNQWIQLTSNSGLTVSTSDVWKLEAIGSTLNAYQNGTLVLSTTDSTYTSGSPGIWLYYSVNQIDNWAGGDSALGNYSVDGTISGIAGTVVLQDNNGDNLSLSSGGSFTFATNLNIGVSYNVTVLTQPSGQICTVTNGSGTISSANITNVTVSCANNILNATDDFNRTDGTLGTNWTDFVPGDGGLAISGQQVVGNGGSSGGDFRNAESYSSDQYSEIQVTSTQLSSGDWIGPAVRVQSGGQTLYLGIYWWNNGSQLMRIYKRISGGYTQLGNSYSCGPLAAGTKLRLVVVGHTIAFLEDGVEKLAAYDNSIVDGVPGMMTNGTPKLDNWAGGNAVFQVDYLSTDTHGVKSYDLISDFDGLGPHVMRVLQPDNPAAGVAHNFVYVLPVEPEGGTTYGDPIETLRGLNAQNQYNLTVIQPSFPTDPWYADSPSNEDYQYESFMAAELEPWVKANLASSGNEQHWLLGFSKSGIGGMDLLLKHPSLFTLGGFWDWPADINSYAEFGSSSSDNYGTDANFQNNYRLTNSFMTAHKAPFLTANRIWISGYEAFQNDITDFDALLTAQGIPHTLTTPVLQTHSWDGGWVPAALANLYQDSLPSVTSFSIPGTASSLTVNISAFTGSDSVSIAGYMLTESTTTPITSSTSWSVSAPNSYTFSSAGTKTLYAWVKNSAGAVSTSASASIIITLPAPTPTPTPSPVISGGSGLPISAFIPPQVPTGGFKVLINQGSPVTNSPAVTLTFSAGSDTSRMAISNSADFAGAGQETFSTSKQWNLCSQFNGSAISSICPDGQHSVYVKFYTSWGQASLIISSSIILKSTAGNLTPPGNHQQTSPAAQTAALAKISPILKFGSLGSWVVLLQERLKILGFFPKDIRANGVFGPTTLQAVKDFQIQNNIAKPGVTGYGQVGPITKQALKLSGQ